MSPANFLCAILVLTVVNRGSMLNWSLLRNSSQLLPSSTNLETLARSKLQSLRNLRSKLYDYQGSRISFVASSSLPANKTSHLKHVLLSKAQPKEELVGGLFKNLESFLSFTGPLKKMISSNQGIESFASMVMPKRDVLKKLLKIKGSLEPTLKRYLTDKFNDFLGSLVPYSENIGVPPFVLNSMKIPLDFDPRWQLIQTILNSNGGVEKFLHSVVNGEAFKKIPEVLESRSGDETDLISDQEPDATGQAYRRQQQLYLSSFKKRLMPGENGGRVRLVPGARPAATSDYDAVVADQSGQYGHATYEVSMPEGMNPDAYYTGTGTAGEMDMAMSASGGRGHSHYGHKHGHASYGGFLDPFTILGGLAFLTYLGLMLQNSLNRNGTQVGRSLLWDSRIPVVPIHLQPTVNGQQYELGSNHRHRSGRALVAHKVPLTVDQVVHDLNVMWKQLNDLQMTIPALDSSKCERYKLCMLALRLKDLNLQFLLDWNGFSQMTNDKMLVDELYHGNGLRSLCHPDLYSKCE